MTPALLALSRAYMALPGAPRQDHPGYVTATGQKQPDGRWRTPDGYLWVWDDETTQMVLDLTDAATGGVMLDRLRPVMEPVIDCDPRTGYALRRMGERFTPGSGRATLAEAVARAAVALGRAG